MLMPSVSFRNMAVTGVLFALTALNTAADTLLSQNFSSDPVTYSLPGASSPFRFYAGPRYWALSDTPGLTVNAAITGHDGPYLAVQNINDGGFSFSSTAPAQIDFAVSAAGYGDLRLSIALAGLPYAETENFIRAKTDNDGDGNYETTVFDFKGSSNSTYTDVALGALTAAFQTFSDLVLAKPTAPDGILRLRLEVFNDTDSANEAAGVDSLVISGTAIPLAVAILSPADGARVATNVVFRARAEGEHAVTNVAFYADDLPIGCSTNSPWGITWAGAPEGNHVLTAVALDTEGQAATSAAVHVTVSLHPIRHAIVISVDGMGTAYVEPLLKEGLANELTTFKRFQAEGVGTLHARDDADYAITLPNHVTMMTSRGVAGEAGHNWSSNTDPLPTDTIANNKGAYVASGFDVAHDNGLRTGIWSGKSKFGLFQQSYGPLTGAADTTGFDNGRDKIDYDQVVSAISAADLTADFTNRMAADPFHFAFIHYQDPDATGHASGWSTNPASAFAATLKAVDTQIGQILQMVTNSIELRDNTAVILTADHGGHGTTHGDTTNPLDYTIPFYVWGAGVAGSGDLYALNTSRTEPGATVNPPYTGDQPVRNGEAANLALRLLGLGAIPGSTINSNRDLLTAKAPAIGGFAGADGEHLAISGTSEVAGLFIVERATSLGASPIVWEPVQTNAVQPDPFLFAIPRGTNTQAFFRLIRR